VLDRLDGFVLADCVAVVATDAARHTIQHPNLLATPVAVKFENSRRTNRNAQLTTVAGVEIDFYAAKPACLRIVPGGEVTEQQSL
jgi:hypothetical protein